jgi:hypothetical protein
MNHIRHSFPPRSTLLTTLWVGCFFFALGVVSGYWFAYNPDKCYRVPPAEQQEIPTLPFPDAEKIFDMNKECDIIE